MFELAIAAQIETARVCLPTHPCIIYTATECEKDPRSCFPEDLVGTGVTKGDDGRGSGRISMLVKL